MSNVVINVIPKPITSGSASRGKRSSQVSLFLLLCFAWLFGVFFFLEENYFICHSTIAYTERFGGQMEEQSETPLSINKHSNVTSNFNKFKGGEKDS